MNPNHRILLVDDNEQALKLLTLIAKKSGYEYDTAKDGKEALEKVLAASPDYYSAVLSDLLMPEMNGIEFLTELKAQPEYQHLPFILQTALSDNESVQKGLSVGAYYYLTKPLDVAVVQQVLLSAIGDFEAHEGLVQEIDQLNDSLFLATEMAFQFKTTKEAKKLAALISRLSNEPKRSVVGLYELMVNSVEHGNLGISYDEKTQFINDRALPAEVERRLALPEYKDKFVSVGVKLEADCFAVTISDMGEGFDFEDFLEFSAERIMDNHGRGIMMANNVGFSEMSYSDAGKTVLCRIDKAEH